MSPRGSWPRGGVRTRLPVVFRKSGAEFTPKDITGLALWLDASSPETLYTTDAGAVTAVSAPTAISGCVGWWDSADLSSMRQNSDGTGTVAAGDPVGWWKDKSATGANVTGSGSARPTLSATGFNSRQSLVFNGSTTSLSNPSYTATNGLSGLTVFAVCGNTSGTANLSRVYPAGFQGLWMNGGRRFYVDDSTNFSSTGAAGVNALAQGLYAFRFASSAVENYEAGSLNAASINGTIPSSTGTNASAAIHIGSNIGANAFWNGPIAEYIIFNRALTRAELARVEAYLAAKWGISGVHAPATATSDPVGAWLDKSGNARHATQSTAGSRPTISATTQNGRKALAFDGSNGWMRTERTTYAARSVFTVFRRTGTAPLYSSPFGKQSTVAAGYGGSSYAVAYGNEGGWSVTDSSTQRLWYTSNGSPHKLSAVYMRGVAMPMAAAQSYQTGIAAAPNTTDAELLYAEAATDTDGNQAWFLGTEPFATTRKYPANILEVLIYNRAITATERQRLERYLAARWGITLAPQVANADAQDWINRVYANGGTVSASTAAAVNTLCIDLENASLRDRFYRLNLFCGTGLNAALVPLYRGPSLGGTQYGGTTDTNGGGLFVSANYSESVGLTTSSGAGQYLNTGLAPNDIPLADVQAMHLAVSHGPTSSADLDPRPLGAHGASDRFSFVLSIRTAASGVMGSAMGRFLQVNSTAMPSGAQASASWVGTRTSATSLSIYKNGTLDSSSATSTTGIAGHAFPFYVCRINNSGALLGDSAPIQHRHYSIGAAMTATQVAAYEAALAAFRTAVGRTT